MKRRARETVLLWLVWLLPVGVAILAAVIGDDVYLSELTRHETILPHGEYWRPELVIIAGVAVVSGAVAVGMWAVLRRYREQVRLRESALREFNTELEAKVAEEVGKQRRQDKILIQQAKMNAMAQMSKLVRYRWRGPLEKLKMFLSDAETKRFSETVMAQKLLEEMTQTFEFFGRTFQPGGEREAVDLSQSVEEALALLEWELEQHGITVHSRLECSMSLPLQRNEVLQVLLGVIRNAMEALVERSIELPRIDIECYKTGQFIVIRICDNGGGVEAGETDRVFDPYFTTKAGTGSGLDIFLARTIVEDHCNGELTFDNLEEGACFYIKIGKHQEEAEG